MPELSHQQQVDQVVVTIKEAMFTVAALERTEDHPGMSVLVADEAIQLLKRAAVLLEADGRKVWN